MFLIDTPEPTTREKHSHLFQFGVPRSETIPLARYDGQYRSIRRRGERNWRAPRYALRRLPFLVIFQPEVQCKPSQRVSGARPTRALGVCRTVIKREKVRLKFLVERFLFGKFNSGRFELGLRGLEGFFKRRMQYLVRFVSAIW